MSKESFGRKIVENITRNMKAIHYRDFGFYSYFDDDFKLALSLSYMALSKEIIIYKDKKDENEITRFSNRVSKEDMDNLMFSGENKPNIINPQGKSSIWYLDAIRDSIMHEHFDIDEENKIVILDNKFHSKKFKAVIDYDWFIDYTKKNIASKRQTNNYVKKGFYYNNYVGNKKRYKTSNIINESILYKIKVSGKDLIIKELDELVEDVFKRYAKSEKETNYNKSFELAKEELERAIKEKYPTSSVEIFDDRYRKRIYNKAAKKLETYYKDYDKLHKDLNGLFERKTTEILNTFIDLFEYVNNNGLIDEKNVINLLNSNDISYSEKLKIKRNLYCVLLNIYGIMSIVVNKESLLNNKDFDIANKALQNVMSISANQEQNIKTFKEYLEAIKLEKKTLKNYKACGVEKKQENARRFLVAEKEREKKEIEFWDLYKKNLVPKKYKDNSSLYMRDYVYSALNEKIKDYKIISLSDTKDKNIKEAEKQMLENYSKSILEDYLEIIRFENKNLYLLENKEKALETVRNSLSHVGRIEILNSDPYKPELIMFNDYDDNGVQSGKVVYRLLDFIDMLENSVVLEDERPKTFTK